MDRRRFLALTGLSALAAYLPIPWLRAPPKTTLFVLQRGATYVLWHKPDEHHRVLHCLSGELVYNEDPACELTEWHTAYGPESWENLTRRVLSGLASSHPGHELLCLDVEHYGVRHINIYDTLTLKGELSHHALRVYRGGVK